MKPEGQFQVDPLRILDRKEIVLQNQVITRVKVQWKHFIAEEETWELEEVLRKKYAGLFIEAIEED